MTPPRTRVRLDTTTSHEFEKNRYDRYVRTTSGFPTEPTRSPAHASCSGTPHTLFGGIYTRHIRCRIEHFLVAAATPLDRDQVPCQDCWHLTRALRRAERSRVLPSDNANRVPCPCRKPHPCGSNAGCHYALDGFLEACRCAVCRQAPVHRSAPAGSGFPSVGEQRGEQMGSRHTCWTVLIRSLRSMVRLRAAWVTHGPIGWALTPRMWTRRGYLDDEQDRQAAQVSTAAEN